MMWGILRSVTRGPRGGQAGTPAGGNGCLFGWPLGLVTLPILLGWPLVVFQHHPLLKVVTECVWLALALMTLAGTVKANRATAGRPAVRVVRRTQLRKPAGPFSVLRRTSPAQGAQGPTRYARVGDPFATREAARLAVWRDCERDMTWHDAPGGMETAGYKRDDGSRVAYVVSPVA
jgi:hypothetical protein